MCDYCIRVAVIQLTTLFEYLEFLMPGKATYGLTPTLYSVYSIHTPTDCRYNHGNNCSTIVAKVDNIIWVKG